MIWLLATAHAGANWGALFGDTGWEEVTESNNKETGTIAIRQKKIDGNTCLRGVARVDVPAEVLYAVVTDIPGASDWSSEDLNISEKLGTRGEKVDYFQYLDVPNWTMAADRFWVLEGQADHSGSTQRFRWERTPWRARYPEVAKRVDTEFSGAVEPEPNYGSWSFTPTDGVTEIRYHLCSNPGGSLPEWLQKAAATKTLPNTVADVVREGRKRAGK